MQLKRCENSNLVRNELCVYRYEVALPDRCSVMCSLQRQLAPDIVGLENDEPTFLQGISMSDLAASTQVSMTEEPTAGKPHAGICAEGIG